MAGTPPPMVKAGPWGREIPSNWEFKLGAGETIQGVIIRSGAIVDGIGFVVVSAGADHMTTTKYFGGQGGNLHQIALKPREVITHISGTYGPYEWTEWKPVIGSIKIHTTDNPDGYGPYGDNGVRDAQHFLSADLSEAVVIRGFFGHAAGYLSSLGVYLLGENTLGPWGSESPTNWDLKLAPRETIKQVNIQAGDIVDGIGFAIADNSGTITDKYFGGNGGNRHQVALGPTEYITHISGTHGVYQFDRQQRIASIKIHTNLNPDGYGPFGEERFLTGLQSFTSACPGFVANGFFGTASQYLDSIGAHIKPYV